MISKSLDCIQIYYQLYLCWLFISTWKIFNFPQVEQNLFNQRARFVRLAQHWVTKFQLCAAQVHVHSENCTERPSKHGITLGSLEQPAARLFIPTIVCIVRKWSILIGLKLRKHLVQKICWQIMVYVLFTICRLCLYVCL